jgi:hypothetical protein
MEKGNANTLSPVVIRLTYIRTIIIPFAYLISIIFSFIYPHIVSIFPLIIIIPVSLLLRWRYKNHEELHAEEI